MRRYIIERDLPAIGSAEREALRQAAMSYVAADKTFCVYLADDEDIIRRHSELSGFPANRITEVQRIIDPTTAG